MGGHHRTNGRTDEWLTPPDLLRRLGAFDLDPCSPIDRPWPTAAHHFTIADDGLAQKWEGRCFVNPPYGAEVGRWLARLASHGNGIALVFARTEINAFHRWVWPKASGILFIRGRLSFYRVDGRVGKNAGAPSVLIAYGSADALADCGIPGAFLRMK